MAVLFDLDFAGYIGAELQEIDPEWILSGSPRLGVRSTGRLSHTVYSGGSYKYHHAGPVRWAIDVYAGDASTGGPAWYFGVGNSGVADTAGAYVQFNFGAQQWRITEGYTVRGSVADDWHTLGAARRLILDWDPAAETLTLTVMDGAVEVGSSTVTGISPDGDYLFLAARWNDEAYHTVTVSGMSATDGGSLEPVNFNESFNISGGGDVEFPSRLGFTDILNASGSGDAALSNRVGYTANLLISGGGDSELTARVGFQNVLALSGGGDAQLETLLGFMEVLSVSGGGDVSLVVEGDTVEIAQVLELMGNRDLNIQLRGDRQLVIELTGNIKK